MKSWMSPLVVGLSTFMIGCGEEEASQNVLRFSTCADYPPFEYYQNGDIVGFDIDVAKLVAKQLGKTAEFTDTDFNSVLAMVASGQADAAIATISVTPERQQSFDFSNEYYKEDLSAVSAKKAKISGAKQLVGKKIACQMGTTMEIWLKAHVDPEDIVTVDTNPQAIEMLKSGHVEVVLVDAAQAISFCQKNPELTQAVIAKADNGYAIAVAKASSLQKELDQALNTLEQSGQIAKLKAKWLQVSQ